MKRVLFFLLGLSNILTAQNNSFSLEESIKYGLENSKEILIAQSNLNISNEKVTEAVSYMLPKISAGGIYNHMNITEPDALGLPGGVFQIPFNEPFNVLGGSLSVQQPLFMGLRMWAMKDAAEFIQQAEEENFVKEKNRIAVEVNKAYWNFYKAKKAVQLLSKNLEAINAHLKNTEKFLENDLVTRNDLLKLQVQVQKVELKKVEAENNLKLARSFFNQTLGIGLKEKSDINLEPLLNNTNEYNYDELVNEALTERKELKSLSYNLMASDKMITAAQSGWFPTLAAFGNYYYYNLNAKALFEDSKTIQAWNVGLSLNWNIWDWWGTSSKSAQAREQKFQLEQTNELLKDKIKLEVYKNYLQLNTEKKKVDISSIAIESAEENLKITKDKYNAQVASSTDIIDAETELMDSQMELLFAQADYRLAQAVLFASIGRKLY